MYLWLCFVLVALFQLVKGSPSSHHCFEPTFHRGISNSPPIAELWDVTPHECLNYCVKRAQELCQSVVYHKHFSSCQLYGHDGTEAPSEIVYADGHDYFNRTSFTGQCQSIRPTTTTESPETDTPTAPVEPADSFPQPYSTLVPPSTIAPSFVEQEECSGSEKEAYFLAVIRELVSPDGATKNSTILTEVEQTDCVKLCAANKADDGREFKCGSINYYPLEKKCKLNHIKAQPHGPGKLIENDDSLYIEKFCLPAAKPADCTSDLFVFHAQMHLINASYFLEAFSGNPGSVEDCVGRCVKHPSCKSSSYNRAAGEWCTLHGVNLGDEPNAIVDGSSEWVFVENGCRLLSPRRLSPIKHSPSSAPFTQIVEHEQFTSLEQTADEPDDTALPHSPASSAEQLELDETESSSSHNTEPSNDRNFAVIGGSEPQAELDNRPKSEETSANWTAWSPCQFQVKGRPVRVRNHDCKDSSCTDGGLQVEKC